MTHSVRWAVLATTAIGLATASGASAQEAEVLHWWTSGGESAAVKQFADQFEKAGGTWVDTAIAGGENARAAGINRIVGGDPPTAMQFNTGKQFDDLVAQGLLASLDDVAESEGWKDLVPPALMDAVTRDGHIYAVPVNVHGQNWLWYSQAAFDKAGVAAPQSWDEFFAAADKLKEAGVIPLAVGGQPWQLTIMFNAVLLGEGGTDLFLKVYRDQDLDAVRSPEFKEVVETFGRLRDYQDEGSPNRNWNDAAGMLINGQAAMQFMGDWEKGEFIAANWTAGQEYGCILGPGNQAFIMGGDVFVFPKNDDPTVQETQRLLARTMLSPETQVAFNNFKGSVPVRTDVDTAQMDACAQTGLAVLSDPAQQIPTYDMLLAPDLVGSIQDVVAEFWADPDASADDMIENFADAIETAG